MRIWILHPVKKEIRKEMKQILIGPAGLAGHVGLELENLQSYRQHQQNATSYWIEGTRLNPVFFKWSDLDIRGVKY